MKNKVIIFLFCFVSAVSLHGQMAADVNISEGGYGLLKTNISSTYEHDWGAVKDAFSARFSYRFFRNKHFTLTANTRYSIVDLSFIRMDYRMTLIPTRSILTAPIRMAM